MTPARLTRSLVLLLGVAIAVGAALGYAATALGIALFVLLLVCVDAKPAWRWFFDPPGDIDSGRASARFYSWRRVGPVSPRERLPRLDRHGC
jgi:hypothetical protein